MFYIIFLSLLIFFKQHTNDSITSQSQLSDILLASLTCLTHEEAIISEKFHDTSLKKEIICSHVIIDSEKENEILKSITLIPSCKINFLKNNESISLLIQFDPAIVKIYMEKTENKEGTWVMICYMYDKKIIDMLEICAKKSILQYTFNRSFSLPQLCVKT